jgi:hypothetical protein
VAGITSEWWPASVRNGGRHQIGIPAGIKSEYLAGMRRNLHPLSPTALFSITDGSALQGRCTLLRNPWQQNRV